MSMPQINNQQWPVNDLEHVPDCPYCSSEKRKLAYVDVEDWSFKCAPGTWNYWDCKNCNSLYLDPRPTVSTIGRAYAKYYTHGGAESLFTLQAAKSRLKNECLTRKLKTPIKPRLHLPTFFGPLLDWIGKWVNVPFGWTLLATGKKGRLMDVGCGDGRAVALAKQLGWDAMGIEIDPEAVRHARQADLNVLEGTDELLSQYEQQFDCIICSHVLEHVHDPCALLAKIKAALKPGGMLLITLPNATSALRHYFGEDWRGLEAPRHIAIPSDAQLMKLLTQANFSVQSYADNQLATAAESYRIRRRGMFLNFRDLTKARRLDLVPLATPFGNDFIKFVCFAPSSTKVGEE